MPVEPLLIGRAAELQAVTAALDAAADGIGPATVVVTGPVGSGISTLTRHAASLLDHRFPDGRITLDTGAPPIQANGSAPSGRTLLGWVLHELGVRDGDLPQSVDGRAAAYRAMLASRRQLIMIDNAVHADQLAPLAPPGSTSALLVASRRRMMRLSNATRLEINALPGPDGLALIAALTGWPRVRAERAPAGRLVALCGGLPLALRVAAMRLASRQAWPIGALVEEMSDPRRRLDLLDYDGLSLRASLARGCAGLAPESMRVLAAMGGAPAAGATARTLASRMRAPVTRVWQALEELTEARLADPLRAGRYALPNDLIRQYARELDHE
jgi:hypothetical protein